MIDIDNLTNQIHAEVEGVAETGFPLEVYPEAIQKIVYELVIYENFNLEYASAIVLSVFATAIGNTYRVNIKGKWVASCAIYMMLVGRAGLGKTPPLNFLYKPIRNNDQLMLEKARQEYESYKQLIGKKENDMSEETEKPHVVQTIISDFTQEAMLSVHYDNPRGIALVVDEIIALFNSAKRYSTKSNLIQDLLSAYSGNPLKAVRKSEALPLYIPIPCINIIGSIQTGLLHEVMTKEYVSNGLMDRFLFVYPKNKKIPEWQLGVDKKQCPNTMGRWSAIIRKVLEIPTPIKEDGITIEPKVLELTEDAMHYFYSWNNGIVNKINAIEDDNEVESRSMKLNGNAARLALILQAMRWAVGESRLDCIDLESVKGAILLIDYFEDSYQRVKASLPAESFNKSGDDWLTLVSETFTSAEAEAAGMRLGLSRRTVYSSLKRLSESSHPAIKREKQGVYSKIVNEYTSAQCTSALSDSDTPASCSEEKVQSAEVQSAADAQEGGSHE